MNVDEAKVLRDRVFHHRNQGLHGICPMCKARRCFVWMQSYDALAKAGEQMSNGAWTPERDGTVLWKR